MFLHNYFMLAPKQSQCANAQSVGLYSNLNQGLPIFELRMEFSVNKYYASGSVQAGITTVPSVQVTVISPQKEFQVSNALSS